MTIIKRVLSIGISACGGGLVLHSLINYNKEKVPSVNASWTTHFSPSTEWDYNWDR